MPITQPRLRILLLNAAVLLAVRTATAADLDGDGVDDAMDVCPNTPPGIAVDAVGRPLGDLDLDCDVDMFDCAIFTANFTGPFVGPEICDDGIDNNGNGLVDCEEVSCDGEPCGLYGQVCVGGTCACPSDIEICDDGIDNDCDGLIDCVDAADCPAGTPCGGPRLVCMGMGLCDCMNPYGDCDGDPGNGCETNTWYDIDNCGDCGHVCSFPHATADCWGGSCFIADCDDGWCDLDGLDINGCEFDLDTDPLCSEATYLGWINGDASDSDITVNGRGETWYRINVEEQNPLLMRDLGITITLAMPAGADYDLYAYCNDCSTLADASAQLGSATEAVVVGWNDNWGSSDERTVYIKVETYAVNTCEQYLLTIQANTPGPHNCPG